MNNIKKVNIKLEKDNTEEDNTTSNLPTEVRLFKAGLNKSSKGIYVYDPARKEEMQKLQEEKDGRDLLPIDIAHNSLNPFADDPDSQISLGWYKLKFDDEGIWATNIDWTARAQDYLSNREFRFISPAFDLFTTTDGDLELTEDGNAIISQIVNFALTNEPATYNPLPLVASKINKLKERVMLRKKTIKLDDLTDEQLEELAAKLGDGLQEQIDKLQEDNNKLLEQVTAKDEELKELRSASENREAEEELAQLELTKETKQLLLSSMSLDQIKEYVKLNKVELKEDKTKPAFVENKNPTVADDDKPATNSNIQKLAKQWAAEFKNRTSIIS